MVNPKKKSSGDNLFPNIEGAIKGFKDPFGDINLGFSNSKGKSGKNQMGDIPNLGSQIRKVDNDLEKVLTGFFNPNSTKGKKCEKCGVQKKDDNFSLCGECLEKENKTPRTNPNSILDPRGKYPASYRTDSGHYVRSRAEQAIANWLVKQNISFTYEKEIPEEHLICDFHLPQWDVWIEYWGLQNEEYSRNKERKLAIYEKHKKKLINLYDEDIESNLEDLPRKLRSFIPKDFLFR
jgi:hypothetical protein